MNANQSNVSGLNAAVYNPTPSTVSDIKSGSSPFDSQILVKPPTSEPKSWYSSRHAYKDKDNKRIFTPKALTTLTHLAHVQDVPESERIKRIVQTKKESRKRLAENLARRRKYTFGDFLPAHLLKPSKQPAPKSKMNVNAPVFQPRTKNIAPEFEVSKKVLTPLPVYDAPRAEPLEGETTIKEYILLSHRYVAQMQRDEDSSSSKTISTDSYTDFHSEGDSPIALSDIESDESEDESSHDSDAYYDSLFAHNIRQLANSDDPRDHEYITTVGHVASISKPSSPTHELSDDDVPDAKEEAYYADLLKGLSFDEAIDTLMEPYPDEIEKPSDPEPQLRQREPPCPCQNCTDPYLANSNFAIEAFRTAARDDGVSRYLAFYLTSGFMYTECVNHDQDGFTVFRIDPDTNKVVARLSFNSKWNVRYIPSQLLPDPINYVPETPFIRSPRVSRRSSKKSAIRFDAMRRPPAPHSSPYRAQMHKAFSYVGKKITDPLNIGEAAVSLDNATSTSVELTSAITDSFVKAVSAAEGTTSAVNKLTDAFSDNAKALMTMITDLKNTLVQTATRSTIRIFEILAGLLLAIWACDRVDDFATKCIIITQWATTAGLISSVVQTLATAVHFFSTEYRAEASIVDLLASVTEVVAQVMDVEMISITSATLRECKKIHTLAQGLKSGMDLVKMITTAYNFVLRRFFGVVSEAQELYDESVAWCEKARKILRAENIGQLLYDDPEYKRQFERLYEEGDMFITELSCINAKEAELSARNVQDVRNVLKQYKDLLDKVRANQRTHKEAVGIHFFGKPGVGKSHLLNYMIADLYYKCFYEPEMDFEPWVAKHQEKVVYRHEAKKLPRALRDLTSADLYPWDTTSEYFAEYHDNIFFVADDPFQVDDQLTRSNIGAGMIHLINVMQHLLNQAELERKGKVFMNSHFFLLSTNRKEFPENMKLEDRVAVERRFPFKIEVKIKPKYGVRAFHEGETYYQLDPKKLPKEEGHHIDPFIFYLHTEDSKGRLFKQEVPWDFLLGQIIARWSVIQNTEQNPMMNRFNFLKAKGEQRVKEAVAKHTAEQLEIATTVTKSSFEPEPDSGIDVAPEAVPNPYLTKMRQYVAQARTLVKESVDKTTVLLDNLKTWFVSATNKLVKYLPDHKKVLGAMAGLAALYFIGRTFNIGTSVAMHASGDPRTTVSNAARLVGKANQVVNRTGPKSGFLANSADPNAMNILVHTIARNQYQAAWAHKDQDGNLLTSGNLQCTFIKEKTFITAKHWVSTRGVSELLHLRNPEKEWVVSYDDLVIEDWPTCPDGVMVTITTPQFPNHSDLTKHLMTKEDLLGDVSDVVTLCYEKVGGKLIPRVQSGRARYFLNHLDYYDGDTRYTIPEYVSVQTAGGFGHCGKVYLVMNSKMDRKILGMHVSAHQQNPESIVVPTYELIECFKRQLPQAAYVAEASFDLQIPPTLIDGGTVPPQQVPRLPSKTSIKKSIFSNYMKNQGFVPNTIPARLMPGVDKDGVLRSPAQEGLNKYPARQPECPLKPKDQELMLDCVHAIARALPAKILPPNPKVTRKEAINGKPGFQHSPKVNMATAVGLPYTLERKEKGKWDFIQCAQCAGAKKCRDLSHELAATESFGKRVDALEEKIRKNPLLTQEDYDELCDLIRIMNCLKDERTKFSKYDSFSTRIFNIMPLDFYLLRREYFMVFLENMMCDPVNSFSALGINVHSPDWGLLMRRVLRRYNLPGDYKFFDGSHQKWLSDFADLVVEEWFKLHYEGIDPQFLENQEMRYKLNQMAYNSLYVMLDKMYRSPGSNPSGDYLTTAKNIIVNALSSMWCCVKAARKLNIRGRAGGLYQPEDWLLDFGFTAFGDDHIEGTDLCDWYTMQLKAKYMAKLGLGYTNPDKTPITEDSPKWYPADKVPYLKRTPVWRDGYCYAPLPIQIIYEILYWQKDENVSATIWAQSSAMSSILEMTHHGEEAFNKWRKFLLTMFAAHDLVVSLPTFREADSKLRMGKIYADEKSFALSLTPPQDSQPCEYWAQARRITSYETEYQKRKRLEKAEQTVKVDGTKYNFKFGIPTFFDFSKKVAPPTVTPNPGDTLDGTLISSVRQDVVHQTVEIGKKISSLEIADNDDLGKLLALTGSEWIFQTALQCAFGMWRGDSFQWVERFVDQKTGVFRLPQHGFFGYLRTVQELGRDLPLGRIIGPVVQTMLTLFNELGMFLNTVFFAPILEEAFRAHSHILGIVEFFRNALAGGGTKRSVAYSLPALIMHCICDLLCVTIGYSTTVPVRVAIHMLWNLFAFLCNSVLIPIPDWIYCYLLDCYKYIGLIDERDYSMMKELRRETIECFQDRACFFPHHAALWQIVRNGGFSYDRAQRLLLHLDACLDDVVHGKEENYRQRTRAYNMVNDQLSGYELSFLKNDLALDYGIALADLATIKKFANFNFGGEWPDEEFFLDLVALVNGHPIMKQHKMIVALFTVYSVCAELAEDSDDFTRDIVNGCLSQGTWIKFKFPDDYYMIRGLSRVAWKNREAEVLDSTMMRVDVQWYSKFLDDVEKAKVDVKGDDHVIDDSVIKPEPPQ